MIKQQQIEAFKKDAIIKTLKSGKIPTQTIVQEYVSQYLGGRSLGMPMFLPYEPDKSTVSNKTLYNNALESAHFDLLMLFKELSKIDEEISGIYNFYECQKRNLISDVERLRLRLNTIDSDAADASVLNFKDFYDSNFTERPSKGLTGTTAFIDLNEKAVKLQKINSLNRKIDLSKSEVKMNIATGFSQKLVIGKLESITRDILNDPYEIIIESKSSSNGAITLSFELPEAMKMNVVTLSSKSISKCLSSLKVSENGTSFKLIGKQESYGDTSWSFESTMVKYINIHIEKAEAEGMVKDLYEYYFMIENVSCYNETYMQEGVHVSRPIEFDMLAEVVTLKSEDNIPIGTSIEHFVGIGEDIVWTKVDNNSSIASGLLFESEVVALKGLPYYGHHINDLFCLCKLPEKVVNRTTSLTYGYQMFKAIKRKHVDSFDIKSIYKSEVTNVNFIDCEHYEIATTSGEILQLTQYVTCEKAKLVERKFMKHASNLAVYVNNIKQTPEANGEYSFKLSKGLNKLEILAEASGDKLLHNFNLKPTSFDISAEPKMNLVNIHNLKGANEFAINDDRLVLIKGDPNLLSTEPTGLRCKIDCKNSKSTADKTTIRIMSVLKSSNENVTPKIMNQTITVR